MKIINDSIPLANVPGDIWQGYAPSPFNTEEFLIKLDHQLTDAHRLSGSYFLTTGDNIVRAGTGNLPWASQQFSWTQHNLNLSDTWVMSDTKINQAWFSFNRNFGGRLNDPATSLADLGSSFIGQGPPSLPQITVSGYFTLSNAIGGPQAGGDFFSARDVLSWTKGAHAIKMGGELSYNKTIQDTLLNNYSVWTFNNSVTRNALADFLVGIPSAVTQDAPVNALVEQLVWRAVRAGRLPHRLAGDVEPRPAMGRADARHRPAGPVRHLRSRAEVHGQPGRAGRAAVLRRSRGGARRHLDVLESLLSARRHRVGSVRRRPDRHPRRRRHVLRQHLRQRVEHDDQFPAVVHSTDLHQHRPGRERGRRAARRDAQQPL